MPEAAYPDLVWAPNGSNFVTFFYQNEVHDSKRTFSGVCLWQFAYPNPTYIPKDLITYRPTTASTTYLQFSPDGTKLAVDNQVWTVHRAADQVFLRPPFEETGADHVLFGQQGQVWHVYLHHEKDDHRSSDIILGRGPVRIVQSSPTPREIILPVPEQSPFVIAYGISPSGNTAYVYFRGRDQDTKCMEVWRIKEHLSECIWKVSLPHMRKYEVLSADLTFLGTLSWARVGNFSPDEEYFTIDNGQLICLPTRRYYFFHSRLPWSPGPLLLASKNIRTISRWGFSSGHQVFFKDGSPRVLLERSTDPALPAVFDPGSGRFILSEDERRLVCAPAGEGGKAIVWDLSTGRVLLEWKAHSQKITAMAFSPDGKTLVAAGEDGTLKVSNIDFILQELAAIGLGD